MELPPPDFFDAGAVGSLFVERAGLVAEAARKYRAAHSLAPASGDRTRIAALGIDPQVAFCLPQASLFVPGAVEDTRRTILWLYRNLSRVTSLFLTLDTHSVHHIFHPVFWLDAEGRHPAPFTIITARDLRLGRFRPAARASGSEDLEEACLQYCETLEASGRHALTVWPYHALLGGASHCLVPALMEAVLFHSFARSAEPHFEIKGRALLTENYSAFSPEVKAIRGRALGAFNSDLFEEVMAHDRVYVFGQAKSHCVLETLRDLERECDRRGGHLTERIFILEDAMSPVSPPPLDPLPEALDFPRLATSAFAALERGGMHLVRTSDTVGD